MTETAAQTRDPLDFSDLTIIRLPVKVGAFNYTLVECSADAASRYEELRISSARDFVDGKPTRLEGTGALPIKLLALCLLDEQGKFVPEEVIKTWPWRVVKALESKAKDISDLHNNKLLSSLKNVPPATPATSE